jgi:hypothetical protein
MKESKSIFSTVKGERKKQEASLLKSKQIKSRMFLRIKLNQENG